MVSAHVALALLGNALNLAYNVPFVYLVIELWDASNLSWYFILMRIAGAVTFMAYAAVVEDAWVGASFAVTFVSSSALVPVKLFPKPCAANVGEGGTVTNV